MVLEGGRDCFDIAGYKRLESVYLRGSKGRKKEGWWKDGRWGRRRERGRLRLHSQFIFRPWWRQREANWGLASCMQHHSALKLERLSPKRTSLCARCRRLPLIRLCPSPTLVALQNILDFMMAPGPPPLFLQQYTMISSWHAINLLITSCLRVLLS